jgi:ribosomal protein RSM22 (predicted rRNA methylase)
MSQAKGYVNSDLLQTLAELLQPLKKRSYAALQIEAYCKVLDVGCGPGIDTIPMAHLIGPGG